MKGFVLVRGKDRLVCRLFEEDKSHFTTIALPPSPMKNRYLTAMCLKSRNLDP